MEFLDRLELMFVEQGPTIVQALIILLVGALIAFALSAVVRRILERLGVTERLNRQVGPNPVDVTDIVSKGVFWLVLLFAIAAALDALRLTAISGPFNNILIQTTNFIPGLIVAAILTGVAWVVATIARRLVEGLLNSSNVDERVSRGAQLEQNVPLSQSLGTLVYWLVWLFFLPGILDALGLQGLLTPVQGLVQDIVAFLPNLLSAAIILLVGYFVARIMRDIVTNLLASTGLDRLAERVGFSSNQPTERTLSRPGTPPETPNSQPITLSRLIGTVVFALILIPVAITALDALNLQALSEPAIAMLNRVLEAIPGIFAAGVLLAIAYFAARLIADIVSNILAGIGFDRVLSRIGLREATPGGRQPSEIVGTLILISIMLFAATEAAGLLGFDALEGLMAQFLVFFGNVLLGLLVLGLGLYLANLAEQTIASSGIHNRDLLGTVARYSIILLTIAMALRQMGIAEDIVTLAFGLLLGAIAVAVALAFGFGGRELAARELNKLLQDMRERPQAPVVLRPGMMDDALTGAIAPSATPATPAD